MKSYMFKSIIFSVIALMLWSCKKDETRIVVAADATAPVVEANYESLVLEEANSAADVMELTWNEADFGYDASINYSIEVGKKDSSFSRVASINMGSSTTRILTVGQFNALVNKLNVVGFEENEMEIRIKSEIGGGVAPAYSNVIPVTVVPYLDKPPYQTLYMVGGSTPNEWDNGNPTPVYRDPEDPFRFTYTGYFKGGDLKYLSIPGKWAPMWGIVDGAVFYRATEGDTDPQSFQIPSAGYYTVTLNLKNTTFEGPTPYAAGAGATVYPSIGIIGPFTDWNSIIPMTHANGDPHNWELTHTFDSDTEVKFRIAADWSANWGAWEDATQTEPYGVGKSGGPNFKVTAGTYLIIFNDMTNEYVFVKQ